MSDLLHTLLHWRAFSALVVGDFMLDQFHYGDAERLSADAPVPILHVKRCEDRPGGAANVCLDLVAMKARVRGFGVTGADPEARLLRDALAREHIVADGLIEDAARPTTIKRNLVGLAQARHPQKMFRVDFESREPLSPDVERRVLAAFNQALPGADVVCLEDYAKGVCTPAICQGVIQACRRAGKPVFVDPARGTDYAKYKGCTAITPNHTEAEEATGMETHLDASPEHNALLARRLLAMLECQAVVLTLDKHGALLLERDAGGEPLAIPTVAREVYDVTGAGDMMLAALAAARANNIAWPDAVRFANAAAGLEVEVFGVEPIPLERIHHELLARERSNRGGGEAVRSLDEVLIQVQAIRRQSKPAGAGQETGPSTARIVFTNGCFDILHAGHVALIQQAARLGDFLIVALNTDASVRRIKGQGRPVNTLRDRARVIAALQGVGAVVAFDEPTPIKLIEALRPDVLVKGADYSAEQVVGGDAVKSWGGRVALIELIEGKSTTATIHTLRGQTPAPR
jgi:D-beta-D-heptose 7-phosphate kinase / D-beta-D-heptose 1-phosphate adenosyltransferase